MPLRCHRGAVEGGDQDQPITVSARDCLGMGVLAWPPTVTCPIWLRLPLHLPSMQECHLCIGRWAPWLIRNGVGVWSFCIAQVCGFMALLSSNHLWVKMRESSWPARTCSPIYSAQFYPIYMYYILYIYIYIIYTSPAYENGPVTSRDFFWYPTVHGW